MSVVGGKLKLKGNVSIKSTSHKSGKDKKKDKKRDKKEKKEKKHKKEKKETPLDKVEVVEEKTKKRERDDDGLDDELSQMTPSERSYEIIQRERRISRATKNAEKTHEEKVEAYNKYLGTLGEYNDIPKVGPG